MTDSDLNDGYKKFNKALKSFLKQLKKEFPHVSEFSKAYDLFYILRKVNPGKAQRIFHKNLGSFQDYVINRNDEFFIKNHFNYKQNSEFDVENLISTLRGLWCSLDDDNKTAIWDHITVIVALSNNCAAIADSIAASR